MSDRAIVLDANILIRAVLPPVFCGFIGLCKGVGCRTAHRMASQTGIVDGHRGEMSIRVDERKFLKVGLKL